MIIFVTTNKHIFHNNSFDRVCVIKFHDPTNLNKPAMKHRITGENSIPALAIHNETTFYNLPQQTSQEFPSNPPLHIPNNSPCWIRIPRIFAPLRETVSLPSQFSPTRKFQGCSTGDRKRTFIANTGIYTIPDIPSTWTHYENQKVFKSSSVKEGEGETSFLCNSRNRLVRKVASQV